MISTTKYVANMFYHLLLAFFFFFCEYSNVETLHNYSTPFKAISRVFKIMQHFHAWLVKQFANIYLILSFNFPVKIFVETPTCKMFNCDNIFTTLKMPIWIIYYRIITFLTHEVYIQQENKQTTCIAHWYYNK